MIKINGFLPELGTLYVHAVENLFGYVYIRATE
jgi:hypothetical protein